MGATYLIRSLLKPLRPVRCWAASLLFVAAPAAIASEDDASFIRIKDGVPAGFADLHDKQTTQADVYYGGLKLTEVFVEYDLATVRIVDPRQIVDSIPNVRDPNLLISRLSGELPTNADQLCNSRMRANCGRLSPDIVDLIFDASRFRIDLFVGRDALLLHRLETQRYLPDSTSGRSFLTNLRASVSGAGDERNYNLGSESFVAFGQARLRARYGLSSDGFDLYEMTWQRDNRDTEYEIGSFQSVGRQLAFASDLDVLGVRLATSTKRRLDIEQSLGSEVLVFLEERSRIDVFRGDELIHTRYYEAGNQQLDTQSFPDGAYEIRIRTTGHSGVRSSTTQFFVRSNLMPPLGEPQYFVEAGSLLHDSDDALPRLMGDVWLRGGTSRRLAEQLAWDGEFLYAGSTGVLQSGLFSINQGWHVYAGGMASNAGDHGIAVRGGMNRGDRYLSFDYRQVHARADTTLSDGFDLLPESYRQGTATFAFPLGKGRAFLRAQINERRGAREESVGVSYFTPLFRLRNLVGNLSFETHFSNQASWAQVGVQIRWRSGRDSAVFNPRLRYREDELGATDFDPLFDGRWNGIAQLPRFGRADRSVFLNHDADRSNLGVRFVPQAFPQTDFEVGLERNDVRSDLYYALNNRMSIVTQGGRTTWGDGGSSAGAVIVDVRGNVQGRFEILVNDRAVGYVWAGRPNIVSLRPYEAYRVRIRPADNQIVGFDERTREVTLYPGNVERLTYQARSLVVIVAQATHEDGRPLVNARFENVEGYGATDELGWFQVETAVTDRLEVATANGATCEMTLPEIDPSEGLVVLDALVCRATPGPR